MACKPIAAACVATGLLFSASTLAAVPYKIVTASERGTYIQIGRDIAKFVAPDADIDLAVLPSAGSAENVRRLRHEPGVKFAMVQSDVFAIPLHNDAGERVGYAGRVIDDNLVDEDNPKYRFPGDRERDGKKFVFRKSELLYHPEEIRGSKSTYIFLVEGFPSVWWLWQHGITHVVAVMGSSLSGRQRSEELV